MKNKSLFENGKRRFLNRFLAVAVSLIFLFFLFFILIFTLKSSMYEGCSCEYIKQEKISGSDNRVFSFEKALQEKIIIVGDSRMSLIRDDATIEKPINVTFVAKSGMKIYWFEDEAIPMLEKLLSNCDENYKYHVVFNMGVNDLDEVVDAELRAGEYYKSYKKLFLKYPKVKFYLLTVNPINEKKINSIYHNNHRTEQKIIDFNNYLFKRFSFDSLLNTRYCNSHDEINFSTFDGLHYTKNTNRKIMNYIINSCIGK